MAITRSGPPTTHDSVLWRVPLSGPPSGAWQQSFQTADGSTDNVSASRVQFEHAALTFRSTDANVPEWIAHIDRWVTSANTAQADVEAGQRGDVVRAKEQSDARRQRASDDNEKFKNL